MTKKWLLLGGFGLALLVTPYLACSSEPTPTVASQVADAQAAVLGTWQGSAEIDGETVPFSLTLQDGATAAKPRALGVVGTLTSENPALNGAVDGAFTLDGDAQHLELALALEDGKTLSGAVEKTTLTDGHIRDKTPLGTFSMSRQ